MSSLTVTFVIFAISVVLFHIPVIWGRVRRPGWSQTDEKAWKRNWEKADYIWLSLSSLALITAAHEVSRMYAEFEFDTKLLYRGNVVAIDLAESARNVAAKWAEPSSKMSEAVRFFDDTIEALNAGDPLLNEAKRLFAAGKGSEALQKLDEAAASYQRFFEKQKEGKTISPAFRTDSPAFPFNADAHLTSDAIEDRIQYTQSLKEAYHRTKKGEADLILLAISPGALAIGLAIRFAKVSSKILVDV